MHLHLKELEQESIEIIRKTYADSIKPVVLYSLEKTHLFYFNYLKSILPKPSSSRILTY